MNETQQRMLVDIQHCLPDATWMVFGSVTRKDFQPHVSDIDVAMFTQQPVQHAIDCIRYTHPVQDPEDNLVTIVYTIPDRDGIMHAISGIKVKYPTERIELSVYHADHRPLVTRELQSTQQLPVWVLWMLLMLKWLCWLGGIPESTYRPWKRSIMSLGVDMDSSSFTSFSYL